MVRINSVRKIVSFFEVGKTRHTSKVSLKAKLEEKYTR